MNSKKIRVLLIIDQCNPERPSVPLLAYQLFDSINKLVDVTLVTHERNRLALEKIKSDEKIIYISESNITTKYFWLITHLTISKKGVNWPLINALGYPAYAEFSHKVYQSFKTQVLNGDYDVVHAITPILPRYPVQTINACKHTPFILGPVNGGVSFPKGFEKVARKEFAYFNFLRIFSQFIPGYKKTYKQADKILVGSTFTLDMLRKMFSIKDNRAELFYENGISEDFFASFSSSKNDEQINLLFVGRLVPYKGADIVIEAVSRLSQEIKQIHLTIVGDGCERDNLEKQAKELGVSDIVSFTGWIEQKETLCFYKKADIFCFPSIREFGGAVVLEAMACGLPCIVTDNGGIAEYVTEETGFKIVPVSIENLTQELTNKIKILILDRELRQKMSIKAVERAKKFTWQQKALKITKIYTEVIEEKSKILGRS